MTCLVIYFHRLTMHPLPPQETIVTVFLPVGPFGTRSLCDHAVWQGRRQGVPTEQDPRIIRHQFRGRPIRNWLACRADHAGELDHLGHSGPSVGRCSVKTIQQVITGEIFVAPDLKLMQESKDQVAAAAEKTV
jgi:hypothetical protein